MATQPNPGGNTNVPPSAYFGPLANADWTGRYLAFHAGYFRITRLGILGYLAIVFVGAVLNVVGPESLRHVNWLAALGFMLTACVLIFVPGTVFGPAAIAFFAAQPGGEQGLSLADGTNWASRWIKALGSFGGAIALYGSLPFFVLALWHIGSDPFAAIALLPMSVFLVIWTMYTNRSGKFVLGLAATIMIGMMVWTFAGWTPVLREYRADVVAWTKHQLGLKSIDDKARDAKRQAEAATAEARAKAQAAAEEAKQSARDACYATLESKAKGDPAKKIDPVIPTQAEFDKCSQIGVEVTHVTPTPQGQTAAEMLNTGVDHKSATVTAPAAAPAPVPKTWVCDQQVRKEDYRPGHTLGRVEIGTLPPGRYEVAVSGNRTTPFYDENGLAKWCVVDAGGNFGACHDAKGNYLGDHGGQTMPAPAKALLPGEPYGQFVIHALGRALPIGQLAQIESAEPMRLRFDVNNIRPDVDTRYYAGQGLITATFRQCRTV